MPVYDRYWRLGVAALVALACLGAGLDAWYLATGGTLEQLLGPSITFSNTCNAVWIVVILCWMVISQLAAARKRERARYAALRGNLDAMPPSRIVPRQVNVVTAELHTARGVVNADDAGLHFHRIGTRKHDKSVPWSEARLLEVWRTSVGQWPVRGFTLYGERAKIEWSLPRIARQRLREQTDAEVALLAAIHSRTGLDPRTLAPALRVPDTRPAERAGPKLPGTILSVVIALLPFAAAAATLLLPLTTKPALNAYIALSFAALGLLIAVAAVQALAELFQHSPIAEPGAILPPGVPPPDMSGTGVYALRWRERARTRLGEVALGLLLVGNVVSLVYLVVLGAETPGADDVKRVLFFALVSVVLLGALLLLVAPFTGSGRITADATGLTAGKQTLRWAAVEEVVARVPNRGAAGFKVVGGEGEVTIEWPAKVHARPQPGAQAVTPGELAALVVARSGKALRVEGD